MEKFRSRLFSAVIFFVAAFCISGCRLIFSDKGIADGMTRREAIVVYGGGIKEKEWLEKVRIPSQPVANVNGAYSVQFGDGILLYNVAERDGVRWIVNMAPPPDPSDSDLREFAESFSEPSKQRERQDAAGTASEETLVLQLAADGKLTMSGDAFSKDQLERRFAGIGSMPEESQPQVIIIVDMDVSARNLSDVLSVADRTGVRRITCKVQTMNPPTE